MVLANDPRELDQKLKSCGENLKGWEKSHFVNIGRQITSIEKQLQQSCPTVPTPSQVSNLIMNSTRMWNDKLIYDIFEPEDAKAITSIPLSAIRVEDKLIWNFAKDGRYTVKSGYKLAKMDMENRNNASSTSGSKRGPGNGYGISTFHKKFSSSHGSGHQPHPATPISDAAFLIKRGKKRGTITVADADCQERAINVPSPLTTMTYLLLLFPHRRRRRRFINRYHTQLRLGGGGGKVADTSPPSVVRPMMPASRRRALSFDDLSVADSIDELEEERFDLEEDLDLDGSGKLPGSCLWEVLRRLPPAELLSAARVCRGWRRRRGSFGVRLRSFGLGFRQRRRLDFDVDATMLACIAFSCPNLQSLEIFTSNSSINRISGDELSRFIAEKRCLTSLKMEGCYNLGGFIFSSTSLSTLWLSDLHSLSKMVFNCPNLKEISLDFSRQENDSTDITNVVDALGRSCPKLQNIHIASFLLSHEAVLALSAANLRGLRMLSLVLGSEITDASVAAIASSFPKLELLDLSGSSVSDSGIGMICNVFPETLTKLLLALCPNITSSGIQFAAAQLPCLELMDCGMTICDPNLEKSTDEEDNDSELQKTPNSKLHLIYQKLIIKHSRLKKLSLWGCSGLDALYLNCPHLTELNLNSCRNLHPERLLLQCGNLESVHASDCEDMLVKTIETQVYGDFAAVENHFPSATTRWLQKSPVPYFCSPQPSDDEKKWRRPVKRQCCFFTRLINSPCDPKTLDVRGFHPSHTIHVSSGGPLSIGLMLRSPLEVVLTVVRSM
ncbi:hypothetical protein DH2020_024656 [Rehmannia glutinosa]|uniref:F-box domain-containing protein n=1 Tax=Rehmannia glutinosa TaxID=99300 RepID=A0ABR0W4D0_REHGL